MAPPSSLFLPSSPSAASPSHREEKGATTGATTKRCAMPFVTQATAQKPLPHRHNNNDDDDRRPFDEQAKDDDSSFLRTKKPRLLETQSSSPSASQQYPIGANPLPPRQLHHLTSTRRTNDEIHSTISLCPVTCLIMDTPAFQRLKGIKQLGSADFVYMNCNTTRFEHSVGVSELARRLITNLKTKQPQLNVTSKDILCVKLAGLLHDVGHGPFSHVYEQFQDYLSDQLEQGKSEEWYRDTIHPSDVPYRGHESVSLLMVRHIFERSLGLELNWEDLDSPLLLLPTVSSACTAANGGFSAPMDDDDDDDDGNLDFSAPIKVQPLTAAPPSSNGIKFDDEDALTTRDVLFIMECIWGRPIEDYEALLGPGFHGRPPHKEWMYDVVCNRHSGLDVDKIDYFARDERRAFKGAGEIDVPMIEEAVVAWAACEAPTACHKCRYRNDDNNNQHHPIGQQKQPQNSHGPRHLMICYPQKHIPTCMDFFKKRFELHTKIYSHKTAAGTAYLICDILCAADPYFRLPVLRGSNNSTPGMVGIAAGTAKREYGSLPISRAFVDPDVYLRCRDSVLDQIANTTDPNLAEARQLISRLWSRDIYKCAVFKVMDMPSERALWALSENEIVDGMLQIGGVHRDVSTGCELRLERRDVLVHKCNIHHGSKDDNPLLQMRFIEKHQLHKLSWPLDLLPEAAAVQESRYDARLPRHFAERSLRIYSRDSAKESLVRHVFEQWYAEFQSEMELTPLAMDAFSSNAPFGLNPDGHPQGGGNGHVAFFCSQESNDDNDDECLGDTYEVVQAGRGLDRSPGPRRSPGGTGGGLGQVTPVRR